MKLNQRVKVKNFKEITGPCIVAWGGDILKVIGTCEGNEKPSGYNTWLICEPTTSNVTYLTSILTKPIFFSKKDKKRKTVFAIAYSSVIIVAINKDQS